MLFIVSKFVFIYIQTLLLSQKNYCETTYSGNHRDQKSLTLYFYWITRDSRMLDLYPVSAFHWASGVFVIFPFTYHFPKSKKNMKGIHLQVNLLQESCSLSLEMNCFSPPNIQIGIFCNFVLCYKTISFIVNVVTSYIC